MKSRLAHCPLAGMVATGKIVICDNFAPTSARFRHFGDFGHRGSSSSDRERVTQVTENGVFHQSPLRNFILESLGENAHLGHFGHSGRLLAWKTAFGK